MANEINITISASTGMGKSTIARYLKFSLEQVSGIKTEIDDFDGQTEIGDIGEIVEGLERIKDKETKVYITTVQTRRKNENE